MKKESIKKKNDEILTRLKYHFGVKTIKEVMVCWGVPENSMNNWRKTGINESKLAVLAVKENLNYDWLIKGEGEKDRASLSGSNLTMLIEDDAKPYKAKDSLEEKLCKIFSKVPVGKREDAFDRSVEVILKFY